MVTDPHMGDNNEIIPGSSTLFLVIADMCSGFDKACVMDVKMGRTTVEPNESEVGHRAVGLVCLLQNWSKACS